MQRYKRANVPLRRPRLLKSSASRLKNEKETAVEGRSESCSCCQRKGQNGVEIRRGQWKRQRRRSRPEEQEDDEWEANDGGKLEAFSQSPVMEQRAAMGRGRGVSNLPSWMTTGATVGRKGMMARDAPDDAVRKGT